MVAGEFDRSQGEHLGPGPGHLEHLVEADPAQLPGLRHDARVGRKDPGHVGVDLAGIGAEGAGECRGGEIRGAAPHRRDLLLDADTLEPGDDRDLAGGQRLAHAVTFDGDDLGLAMARVGDDPDLAAGEADGVDPEVVERHRQQCRRDAFAGRQEHVHLAAVARGRDLRRQGDEVVGRLAHRRGDDDDVVAVPPGEGHVVGDGAHPIGVGDGRASVLLDDQRHRVHFLSGPVARSRATFVEPHYGRDV